jgi:hypothetical protein
LTEDLETLRTRIADACRVIWNAVMQEPTEAFGAG